LGWRNLPCNELHEKASRHALEAGDIQLRSVIRVSNPSQSAVENLCYPIILLDIHAIIIYIFIRELDTLFLFCL
jgi:hypothetical protein